jgi:hypothetical protein
MYGWRLPQRELPVVADRGEAGWTRMATNATVSSTIDARLVSSPTMSRRVLAEGLLVGWDAST